MDCPTGAAQVHHFKGGQIEAMIEAAIEKEEEIPVVEEVRVYESAI